MKVSKVLINAKSLIEDPIRWTQGAHARNSVNKPTGSISVTAICFCSLGALNRTLAKEGLGGDIFLEAELLLGGAMGYDVAGFNDSATHSEVMEAWDFAIKLALEKEGEV